MPSSKRIIIQLGAHASAAMGWSSRSRHSQNRQQLRKDCCRAGPERTQFRALAAVRTSPAQLLRKQQRHSLCAIRRAMRAGPSRSPSKLKRLGEFCPSVKALADVDGVPMVCWPDSESARCKCSIMSVEVVAT